MINSTIIIYFTNKPQSSKMPDEFDNSTLNSLAKAYCGAAWLEEAHVEICNSATQIGLFFVVAFALLLVGLFDFFLEFSWTRVFAVLHSVNVGE